MRIRIPAHQYRRAHHNRHDRHDRHASDGASTPSPRRHTRLARFVRFTPLVALLLASGACTAAPSGGFGPPTVAVTHRSPRDLILMVVIAGQYAPLPTPNPAPPPTAGPTVNVHTIFHEASSQPSAIQQEVVLPSGAQVTCNGVAPTPDVGYCVIPRLQPGERYTITVTDEHGNRATVFVPVPPPPVTITQPQLGDSVPLPPVGGTVPVDYTLQSAPPISGIRIQVHAVAANCAATYSIQCNIAGPMEQHAAVSGTTSGTYRVTGDFSPFRPGAGVLIVVTSVDTTVDQEGFAAASASFSDYDFRAITWISASSALSSTSMTTR